MDDRAIVVFAHGSSVAAANDAVRQVAAEMARRGGFPLVAVAFLDCAQPDLKQAISDLAASGSRRFLVVPYFLTLGTHLQRDLPRMVRDILEQWPGIEIEVRPPLDGHPALADILVERVRGAATLETPSESSPARVS